MCDIGVIDPLWGCRKQEDPHPPEKIFRKPLVPSATSSFSGTGKSLQHPRGMRLSLILTLCLLPACGYYKATTCPSGGSHYGHVESVLSMDCDVFEADAEIAVQSVLATTSIDEWTLRHRMRKGQVTVRSVGEWEATLGPVDDELVIGLTVGTHIAVGEDARALAHETLHLYDTIGIFDNLGSILAIPVEAGPEESHDGWGSNGYFAASDEYERRYTPLTWEE